MTAEQHTQVKTHRRLRIIFLKLLLWLLLLPVILLIISFAALQIPRVQTYLAHKAVNYANQKSGAKISLKKISISLSGHVELEELFIPGTKADTLFYCAGMQAGINIRALFSKRVELSRVVFKTLTAHIHRNASGFNFDYLIRTFNSGKKNKAAVADSSAGWQLSLKQIDLSKIYATYYDQSLGMDVVLRLGNLNTSIQHFDLAHHQIDVGNVKLDSAFFSLVQFEGLVKDTAASGTNKFQLRVSDIDLQHVSAIYQNKIAGMNMKADIGLLDLQVKAMDLLKQSFDVDKVLLQHSSFVYTQHATIRKAAKDTGLITKPAGWNVRVKKLDLENNLFGYSDERQPEATAGMDYAHLLVKQITAGARDVEVNPYRINGEVNHMSLTEKSGFVLKKLKGEFVYDTVHILASCLELETPQSAVYGRLGVGFRSIDSIVKPLGDLLVDARLDQTTIAANDIAFFAPGVFNSVYLAKHSQSLAHLNGMVQGKLDALRISGFEVSDGQTLVKLNGNIDHVLSPRQMYVRLSDIRVSGSRTGVYSWIPDSLIPGAVQLPEQFSLKGSFTGYIKNFDAELFASTSFGDARAVVKMQPSVGNRLQPYHAQLDTRDFDLGKLLKQPATLGPVTVRAVVDGSGMDTSMDASVKLSVEKAWLKSYDYRNIMLSGRLVKRLFNGSISASDPNLSFVFDGNVNLDPRYPAGTFTLQLHGADLKALHVTEEDVRLSATVVSNLQDSSRKNITGTAKIANLVLLRNNKKYRLDSLVIVSEQKDSVSEISIRSEIMKANVKGNVNLARLPATFMRQLNSYFRLPDSSRQSQTAEQDFTFDLALTDPSMLSANVIPRLERITPATLKGSYNSRSQKLLVTASVPEVKYNGIKMDSLRLEVNSDKEKLTCGLYITELSNKSLKTENLSLTGELKNNTLSFQLNTNKDDSTRLLAIGGSVKSLEGKSYALHFNPELVFNAESWQIDPANALVFSKQGMYVSALAINGGNANITINSAQKAPQAPLELRFHNFELATVSKILENNNELLRGKTDGSITFEKRSNATAFSSDLVISNLSFKGAPIGTVKLKADNFEAAQKYRMSLAIDGSGNEINVNGFYTAGQNSSIDFVLNINRLEMAAIEPFTFGQVSRMSGWLDGTLSIKGSTAKPNVSGALDLHKAAFRPRILDSYLLIHEGRIAVTGQKIRLNELAVFDSLTNKATVNGFMDIHDLSRITADLQVRTDNFLALNTDRRDNPLYYGRVFLDSDIRLRGPLKAPALDVKARINQGSFITYVRPENLVTKNESKGIVEFTDSLRRDTTIMMRLNDSIRGLSGMTGIELNANISFDRTVQLKMLVDQESGDSLYVTGGGTLDFNLDRSGKTTLTGKYRINDGGYHLGISNVVKRNFRIEKGSSVSWSGDVMDAYVDLKAVYTIKTSPIDLVQDEASAMSELERNKYRNLLTFNVYLKMTGFISSPDISFDIQLAPGDRGALNGTINSKLAQLREDETELNKQVFALLTLRRFIGNNPLDNGSDGGGFSSASRSSASKVLTQQLSTLSDKYVNFVDLDLGVNSFEDYSTGQEQGRTQLQVSVSRQILNDKITVRVGGNVELEGERAQQNNASDVAGNISIDYKLTNDGRYKLKAFRENQYENPIEGELTKTGLGLIYTRNYNTLKELISKPVKKNNTQWRK